MVTSRLTLTLMASAFYFSHAAGTPAAEDSGDRLRQETSDLLDGKFRAICYSGFRRGQHPDRGEVAVNPSDDEILEDLQILTRHGFSLIRLYDSAGLVITEAGWATTASEFGARASEAKQQRYYRELFEWAADANITNFFFAAFDESWKGDPNDPRGAEKHWGLFTEARAPKLVMKE